MDYGAIIDSMSPAQQQRLQEFGDALCEWADEEKRETHTKFGYKHGQMPMMVVWMFTPMVFVVIAWVAAGFLWLPSHPLNPVAGMPFLYASLVVAFVPLLVVPFIFMKVRKALLHIAVLAIILFFGMLCMGGMQAIFG